MSNLHCAVDQALLVLVDFQPTFLKAIHNTEGLLQRSEFLLSAANALGIPVAATVQNQARMGGLDPRLGEIHTGPVFEKMAFSCWGSNEFREFVDESEKTSIVLIGIETHICVTLTAIDLLSNGYQVFVCPDAVSSRSFEMHKIGMERIRDSGAIPSHTETLVYEWMGTAENAKFKSILELVKAASA